MDKNKRCSIKDLMEDVLKTPKDYRILNDFR